MGTIVDLSVSLDERFPGTWPGQRWYEHVVWKDFPSTQEPYSTCHFTMDEHCGTHCDAPAHFIRATDKIESDLFGEHLDLSRMQGPLAVMDVRYLNKGSECGISPWIEIEDIVKWEHAHQDLSPGDILVFQTGWDSYYLPDEAGSRYVDGPIRDKKTPG